MSTDAGTSRAGRPKRLATSATVPRERGVGAPPVAVVAEGCVAAGLGTLVALGIAFGGSGVAVRARGFSLGAAGFGSAGRRRVRGASMLTGGRRSCPASGGTGAGVVAGVAGATGAAGSCACPDPQAEIREAATIVELSHRDRRTLSGVVLAEKLHAVRSRTQSELRLLAVIMVEDTETPRVARLVARHRE